MHPSALWTKSVTWGTPLIACCLFALFSFPFHVLSRLLYFYLLYCFFFLPVFQFLCLFLLSIKAFPSSPPLSFSFSTSLICTSFPSFFSPFSLPLSPFFYSSLPATHFPCCQLFLFPPSVSFIHHSCCSGLQQGARERGSMQRQESPTSYQSLTPVLKPHIFLLSFLP